MAELISAEVPRRVVIHIDLDCFYAQVEQKRLAIPRDVPCAVQQWEGLIAVNYAARAKGVTRHMRVHDAKKVCPELQLVHVETLGGSSGQDAQGSHATAGAGVQRRDTSKACLQRYRQASADIIRTLRRQLPPGTPFEKASIDEMYIDISGMVDTQLKAMLAGQHLEAADGADVDVAQAVVPAQLVQAAEAALQHSIVVGDKLDSTLDYDCWLIVGCLIAKRLREVVLEELAFTCSAGIASNKIVAKVGSALNKPNKQTVVPPRHVQGMLQDMPLGKIRGFGGKLGSSLEQLFGAVKVGDVQALTMDQLKQQFGDRARWIYQLVRGQDNEPVMPKDKVKSINSCKSFEATHDLAAIERWMLILAEELTQRIADDEADNRRRPKSLVLHYRGSGAPSGPGHGWAAGERSVRCQMPPYSRDGPSAPALCAAAMSMFRRLPDGLPCTRLALSAAEFTDMPASAAHAITRFFGPAAKRQRTMSDEAAGRGKTTSDGSEAFGAGAMSRGAKLLTKAKHPSLAVYVGNSVKADATPQYSACASQVPSAARQRQGACASTTGAVADMASGPCVAQQQMPSPSNSAQALPASATCLQQQCQHDNQQHQHQHQQHHYHHHQQQHTQQQHDHQHRHQHHQRQQQHQSITTSNNNTKTNTDTNTNNAQPQHHPQWQHQPPPPSLHILDTLLPVPPGLPTTQTNVLGPTAPSSTSAQHTQGTSSHPSPAPSPAPSSAPVPAPTTCQIPEPDSSQELLGWSALSTSDSDDEPAVSQLGAHDEDVPSMLVEADTERLQHGWEYTKPTHAMPGDVMVDDNQELRSSEGSSRPVPSNPDPRPSTRPGPGPATGLQQSRTATTHPVPAPCLSIGPGSYQSNNRYGTAAAHLDPAATEDGQPLVPEQGAATAGPASSAAAVLLGVDLAEQKRILHDIEIQRLLARRQALPQQQAGQKGRQGKRANMGNGSSSSSGRGGKQLSIASLFSSGRK